MSALSVATGLAMVVGGSALATQRPATRRVSAVEVTGRIAALGVTKITVGKTSCSLRTTKIAEAAQAFAPGENVTVVCVEGALRSIVLTPVTGGTAHSDLIVAALPAAQKLGTSSSGNGGRKIIWTTGSTSSYAVTGTINVSGTVTGVGPGSVTVDGQTCSVLPLNAGPNVADALSTTFQSVQIGDQAQMTCTTFSNGTSSGSISFSQNSGA